MVMTPSSKMSDHKERENMGGVGQEAFFFENHGSKLFGFLHVPHRRQSMGPQSRGIVFCHPFAEEKTISHRVVNNFARRLCRQGYPVLRFDYRGCGDSEGDFEQATLKTRLADIGKAIDIFFQHTQTVHLSLFGLRLGATLAALTAAGDSRVDSLVLWEPIVDVGKYFDQFLRMQVVAESTWSGKVAKTRKDLLQELTKGNCVDILSFYLSPQCFEEFTRLDVPAQVGFFQGPVLIVGISKQQRKRKDLEDLIRAYQQNDTSPHYLLVPEQPFWIDPNNPFRELVSLRNHELLFNQTVEWLKALDDHN
jgi:exosortase A-associated hydrolase 2